MSDTRDTDYISKHKCPTYVIRHGWGKQVSSGGEVVAPARNAAVAQFEPIDAGPVPTSAPFREAKGRLNIAKTVQVANQAGWKFTPDQVHKFLRAHQDYGHKIVAVDKHGTAMRVDWIIDDALNAGKRKCILCDKGNISPKGVSAHTRTPIHLERLEGMPVASYTADMGTGEDTQNPYYLTDIANKAGGVPESNTEKGTSP